MVDLGKVIRNVVLPLGIVVLGPTGCETPKINPKEIAIAKLESQISTDENSREGQGYWVVGKVLNDSSYTLTYSSGKTDTLKMSIETTTSAGNPIYRFNLDMLPSFVEIAVIDNKAYVTKTGP